MVKFIVKLLLLLLLLAIVVLGVALVVRDDPGFVLLRYHGYEVETTLAFALGALIVLVIAFYYCVRLLRGLWRLPRSVQRLSQNRRFSKAQRQLSQGLIDLAEGRFEKAENHLVIRCPCGTACRDDLQQPMKEVSMSCSNPAAMVHASVQRRAARSRERRDARPGTPNLEDSST